MFLYSNGLSHNTVIEVSVSVSGGEIRFCMAPGFFPMAKNGNNKNNMQINSSVVFDFIYNAIILKP
jgi:hypothetical protein